MTGRRRSSRRSKPATAQSRVGPAPRRIGGLVGLEQGHRYRPDRGGRTEPAQARWSDVKNVLRERPARARRSTQVPQFERHRRQDQVRLPHEFQSRNQQTKRHLLDAPRRAGIESCRAARSRSGSTPRRPGKLKSHCPGDRDEPSLAAGRPPPPTASQRCSRSRRWGRAIVQHCSRRPPHGTVDGLRYRQQQAGIDQQTSPATRTTA